MIVVRCLVSGCALMLAAACTVRAADMAVADPLARKVSLSARGVPLEEVLAGLSREGVQLRAARHLREKRLTFYAKEERLSTVMDSIASLWSLRRYPARWVKSGKGGTYDLVQNEAAEREGDRIEQQDRQSLGKALARLTGLHASDAGADPKTVRIEAHSPQWNRAWCATTGAMLRELPPGALTAALRGETVRVPSTSFSPGTQELLFTHVAMHRLRGTMRPGVDPVRASDADVTVETPADRRRRFANEAVVIRVEQNDGTREWNCTIRTTDGQTEGSSAGVVGPPIGFSANEDEISSSGGAGGKTPADGSTAGGRSRTPLTAEQRSALRKAAAVGVHKMADAQDLLFRVLHRPVIGDYYVRKGKANEQAHARAFAEALVSNDTLEGFLQDYLKPLDYRFMSSGPALIFRSRMWWIDDLREPPLSLARRLAQHWKEQGFLGLPDLGEAAQLRPTQLETLGEDFLSAELVEGLTGAYPWLHLYGILPPALQARARSTRGLPLREIPDTALGPFLSTRRGGMVLKILGNDLPDVMLTIEQREGRSPRDEKPVVRTMISLTRPGGSRALQVNADQILRSDAPPGAAAVGPLPR